MLRKLLIACCILLVVLGVAVGTFFYLAFHRVQGQYFDSNGFRIHYTVEGKGEPVILIHGLAANADLNWRRPGPADASGAADWRAKTFVMDSIYISA